MGKMFQINLQTGSQGWDNEGNMEKFQLIFSHAVKTITPLARFLIKNLAGERIFLSFFSMRSGKLTCLQAYKLRSQVSAIVNILKLSCISSLAR